MKFKIFTAILMAGFLVPFDTGSELNAAHHKKKLTRKKVKRKAVVKRYIPRPIPEIKDKSFYCDQPTCVCPVPTPDAPAQTPPVPTPQPTPQPEVPKVETAPISIQPMKDHSHTKYEGPEDEHLGLYFGCNVGPLQTFGTYNLKVGTEGVGSGLSGTDYDGDVYIGYVRKAEQYGVGIQAYYDPFAFTINDSLSLNNANQTFSINFSDAFGGVILLGYYPEKHTFLYARGGMEFQKISLTLKDSSTPSSAFDPGFVSKKITTLGFGGRYVMGNIMYGAECIYKNYPTITVPTNNTTVTPQTFSIRISVGYLF